MEYLKLFNTESDYLAYRDDKEKYLRPNVSICEANDTVYYNYPPKPKTNGHDYVDLGLPSHTLWATMNVGASKPSDYGLYFQWGDTVGYTKDQVGTESGKKNFSWADYKWSIDGSSSNFNKYNTTGATLELYDDAAHVNMGGDWHIPSPKQIQELTANTTSTWTTQDGVNGRLFTSKTDTSKSIFIPAAGYASYGSLRYEGSEAVVWSYMLYANSVGYGHRLVFDSSGVYLGGYYRCYGFSVRGVLG